jgi:hypothetical protein
MEFGCIWQVENGENCASLGTVREMKGPNDVRNFPDRAERFPSQNKRAHFQTYETNINWYV